MLFSRAEKVQDGDAIQVTSHLHQHNSNSEKRALTTSRQRFLVYSFSHTLIRLVVKMPNASRFVHLVIEKKKPVLCRHNFVI